MARVCFLGYGAGYNPSLGPTCAFFRQADSLYLLDCGTSALERLVERDAFSGVKNLTVFISHLHADHIGSLGILLDYCWDMLGIKSVLVYPSEDITSLMSRMGVSAEAYRWDDGSLYQAGSNGVSVRFLPVQHAPDLPCYAFLVDAAGDRFYYSGDSNDISEEIVQKLINGEICRIYQDTASKESAYHCSVGRLCTRIPKEYRNRVYCMHLDAGCYPISLRHLGFSLAYDSE